MWWQKLVYKKSFCWSRIIFGMYILTLSIDCGVWGFPTSLFPLLVLKLHSFHCCLIYRTSCGFKPICHTTWNFSYLCIGRDTWFVLVFPFENIFPYYSLICLTTCRCSGSAIWVCIPYSLWCESSDSDVLRWILSPHPVIPFAKRKLSLWWWSCSCSGYECHYGITTFAIQL